MPRPGSMRLTEQSTFTGRSSTRCAVNPAPIHSGSEDSMNMPFELISRVLARRTAEPHSISRLARNEYRGAQRLSERRGGWSPLAMNLVNPLATHPKLRRRGELAARTSNSWIRSAHSHTTPELELLFPILRLLTPGPIHVPERTASTEGCR